MSTMRSQSLVILVNLVLLQILYSNGLPVEKKPKILALFNVITFENGQCTTKSSTGDATRYGTCYGQSECEGFGGMIDGSCASGFGVCCVLRVQTCGGDITRNCTYVQNPGWPSAFNRDSTTMCRYTIPRNANGICSLRLDFDTFQINNAPAATGICGGENIMAMSPTGAIIPPLCGTLSGQHMYVSTGTTSPNLGSFTINFNAAVTATRIWDIKVTTIPCDSFTLPPDGCLQYFTGLTGIVQNYNFGTLLTNLAYNNCFRQEMGFCQIAYTVDTSSSTPDSFSLDIATVSKSFAGQCANANIAIPSTVVGLSSNFYCGEYLNTVQGRIKHAAVVGNITPFMLRVTTVDTALPNDTGFKLRFSQIPC